MILKLVRCMTEPHSNIRKRIIKHLDGLNELERIKSTDKLVETLAERYDVPENMVQKILAEWSAGKEV